MPPRSAHRCTTYRYHQDYDSLKRQHNNRHPFIDPTFPPNEDSINSNWSHRFRICCKRQERVVWLRPHQISENPQFIVEGHSRFDVNQGALGNCWFIAALQAIAEHELLEKVIVFNKQGFGPDYAGIFHFRFWVQDRWEEVVIDDYLPTEDGKLKYCQNRGQENEFWAPLLEKAYAKLHGTYEALAGGFSDHALSELTNGTVKNYERYELCHSLMDIYHACENREFLTCFISGERDRARSLEKQLPADHEYTITGLQKLDSFADVGVLWIIRIRNPHGTAVEWKGAWSDRSSTWERVHRDLELKLRRDKADGEFWMSFQEFCDNFDGLTILSHFSVTSGGAEGGDGEVGRV